MSPYAVTDEVNIPKSWASVYDPPFSDMLPLIRNVPPSNVAKASPLTVPAIPVAVSK